ncbi:MAG: endopeptidase La [Ruminococcaceae bacterium]|nr:endopeptidase La [Oscillospiraceae bacterium]
MNNKTTITTSLPVLAMRGVVVFPKMTLHFDVGRQKSIAAIRAALNTSGEIFLTAQLDSEIENPEFSDLNKIGVVAEVKQVIKLPNTEVLRVVVEGKYRATVVETLRTKPILKAVVTEVKQKAVRKIDSAYSEALVRTLRDLFDDYADLLPRISPDVEMTVHTEDDIALLTDYIASNTILMFEDKQDLLSELNPIKRAEKLCSVLIKETEILSLQVGIQNEVHERMDKNQKDYFLREQLKVISQELNGEESPEEEAESYKEKINALPLEDKYKKKLLDEADRLLKLSSSSSEANVTRTYLDRVLALPWNNETKDSLNLAKARKVLDKDHYGLDEVKERIVELIAVKKLSENVNSQILCLVGPPGVGKTSIAKSLAKAMNKNYARISLGGVHDEAEIRGHRRTYIGAMPGRIISAVEQAGSTNALILLDEIDKLGNDYKGDPSSALLEVLDGEQNNTFVDHYIDVPFDLSKVLFITTANDASSIPGPLYDRMEIIELYSYTLEEKFRIAKKHLLPKQLKNFNMTSKMVSISDSALKLIIDGYTKEAGVRTLERVIIKVLRKCAVKFVDGFEGKISVTPENLEEFLGARKYKETDLSLDNMIGAVNGLAWTKVGGEIMQIEASILEGTGKIELTGSLGDVMKESAKIAVSFVRSRANELGIDPTFYKDKDIHIHAPEGAVPKDGPSAGVTMTTALVSALTNRPVKPDVAMTGEISLRGNVLAIGGLKEKSMAAYKNKMKTVLIPQDNVPDLEKVDEVVKKNIEFIPVSTLDEVLNLALTKPKKSQKDKRKVVEIQESKEETQATICC